MAKLKISAEFPLFIDAKHRQSNMNISNTPAQSKIFLFFLRSSLQNNYTIVSEYKVVIEFVYGKVKNFGRVSFVY
jgi:hypothetical protein